LAQPRDVKMKDQPDIEILKTELADKKASSLISSLARFHWGGLSRTAPKLKRKSVIAIPTGPKGEKRPADVIGNAVKVMRIATGEESEDFGPADTRDQAARALGKKGGTARAKSMTPERRTEIAKKAAMKRWRRS
jgi:hypothetical protein